LDGVWLEEDESEVDGKGERDVDWELDTVGVKRVVGDTEGEEVIEGEGLVDREAETDA